MMQESLLTVCIITYNHERFISQAIESVLMQNVNFKFEILIADDCSTDGTRAILKTYQQEYPNQIKLILQEKNVGPSKNWLDLVTSPQSKYIAYFEGDDFWTDPNKLQKQVDFLEANPEYVVCYHNANSVDENSKQLASHYIEEHSCKDYTSEELKKSSFMLLLTICYRNCISTFPEEFIEFKGGDTFFISLLGQHGNGKYMHNIDVGASYRIHAAGAWNANNGLKKVLHTSKSFWVIAKYYKRIKETALFNYFNDRYKWKLKEAIQIAKKERNYKALFLLYFQMIKAM